jgi:Short C-terminal domain
VGFLSRKKEQAPEAGDPVVSGEVPPAAKDVVDQLEHMFPGAHIAVESKTITDPTQVQAALQAAFGGPGDRESARVAALERLAELHKHGALTDEEFDWEKKKILDAG